MFAGRRGERFELGETNGRGDGDVQVIVRYGVCLDK